MAAILTPGFIYWDGFKYVLEPGTFVPAGDLAGNAISQQVVGIETHPVPGPTGSNTVLTWDGYFYWGVGGGGGGGITQLTGDVTAGPGTGSVAATVVGIRGNTVTSGALVKGDLFIATTTSNWAGTAVTGDVGFSSTTPGLTTVLAINGTTVPATPSANQLLVATSGTTAAWTTISGDATVGSVGVITNTGLRGIIVPVPSGSNTTLTYNSGAYTWVSGGGGGGSTIGYGSYSSRPGSPGSAGNMYVANDGPIQFVSDGTTWHPLLDGVVGVQPPAVAGWGTYGGTLGFNDLGGSIGIGLASATSSTALFGRTRTISALSNYNIYLAFKYFPHPQGGSFGVFIGDGTKAIYWGVTYQTSGICTLSIVQYTNATTPSSTVFTMNLPGGISGDRMWFNINYSVGGGKRSYEVIVDGTNENSSVYQESTGTFLTETEYGVAMTCAASSVTAGQSNIATLQSWTGPT
jgi:hypothetical protein